MGQFFVILLLVVGYFVAVSVAVSRSDNKRALSKIALGVLLVYSCVLGMLVAVGQYLGEVGLLLYLLALLFTVFYSAWGLYHFVKRRPQLQLGALAVLASYLLALLYITTFMRSAGSNHQIQMEVFNWLREDAVEDLQHIFLNVAMFVPVGFLSTYLTEESHGKLLPGLSLGIVLSTLIETGQLLFHSGTCDIDDILANSLGALLGALLAAAQLWLKRPRKAR